MSPDDHISSKSSPSNASTNTPTRSEAEQAVRTLIRWMGDDPTREGLIDTPKRVINSYAELLVDILKTQVRYWNARSKKPMVTAT